MKQPGGRHVNAVRVLRSALGCALAASFLGGCGGSQGGAPQAPAPSPQASADPSSDVLVRAPTDTLVHPTYSGRDLDRAVIIERGAIAEQVEHARVAQARREAGDEAAFADWTRSKENAAVRGRFLATLVACRERRESCPPKLDDPGNQFELEPAAGALPIAGDFRFDLASWQQVSKDMARIACSCRTTNCIDGMYETLRLMESRPTREVQLDDTGVLWLTHARECLGRLRPRWAGDDLR